MKADWGAIVAEGARFAFLGALALAPLLFGGNVPLAWALNAALVGGVAAVFATAHLWSGVRLAVSADWIRAPLIAFAVVVIWIVIQSASWTPAILHHPIWRDASDALGQSLAGSISVAPDDTRLALLRLVTAAVTFWLALEIGRHPLWAHRILLCVAVAGAIYALYGLIEHWSGARRILWLDKAMFKDVVTGTFVNPNHFAVHAGLAFLAGFALLMRDVTSSMRGGFSPRTAFWPAVIVELGGPIAKALLVLAPTFTSIVLSGSRAGFALVFLGIVTMVLIEVMRGRRVLVPVAVGGIVICGALLILGSHYGARVGSDLANSSASDITSRLGVASISLSAIQDALWTGYGYGTFADVFPAYRDSRVSMMGIWREAHNGYIEAMLGLGVPVAMLLFLSVGMLVARTLVGALARRRDHWAPLVAFAASVVLGLHALIDYSIQVQGVTLTYAALLGAGCAQSWSSRRRLDGRLA